MCFVLMDEVAEGGEMILIMKCGKIVVKLVFVGDLCFSVLGCLKRSLDIVDEDFFFLEWMVSLCKGWM